MSVQSRSNRRWVFLMTSLKVEEVHLRYERIDRKVSPLVMMVELLTRTLGREPSL